MRILQTISITILVACVSSIPFGRVHAADGVLYITPSSGSYTIGDVFDVVVRVNSDGMSINAAEAELEFDPIGLTVEKITTDASIFTTWPTPPEYNNETGTIRFAGWVNKAFTGSDGHVVTITFRALQTTKSNARFAAGAILANDGRGSNILTGLQSAVYTIAPQQITAPEPDQELTPETEEVGGSEPDLVEDAGATTTVTGTVEPPRFTDFPYTLTAGERIIVQGNTVPNARVFVWLSQGQALPTQTTVMSTPEGTFTYVSQGGAEAGVYRVWAEVQDASGVQSSPSETITFTAQPDGLAAAAASGASVISAVLPLLALIIAGGLGVGYLMHRHKVATVQYEVAAREEH